MTSATPHKIDDYESLLVALQNVLGVVVPESQRSCLVERVEPLLSDYKLESLALLAQGLQGDRADGIKSSVLEAISQSHSDWALSAALSGVLKNYIFSQLPEQAKILLVGSGYGQLAYAVAMQLAEYEQHNSNNKQAELFAIDSSLSAIKFAQQATYSPQALTGLSEEYKKLYTTSSDGSERRTIKDKIRQRVHFSQCDLTEDFQSIGQVDLIICPEVLVYFSNGVKAGILKQFSTLLKAGGILLTGNNQAVTPLMKGFERVEHPAGVFYRQKH
ncbi:MAG: CheR family methyltransferase [Gammaproteobacteria bacterium]|nr:CheR family methyltransferase [Gammaproteobacteria bacterium]